MSNKSDLIFFQKCIDLIEITSLNWHPDGNLLATVSFDKDLNIFDVRNMMVIKTYEKICRGN